MRTASAGRAPTRSARWATFLALAASGLGCDKLLGIHDLNGGGIGDSGSGSSSSSLSDSSGVSSSSSTSFAGATTVSGTDCLIESNTHWKQGVYVVQCDLSVDAAFTLDPGVIVKFALGFGMTVSQTGTVAATGMAGAPIVFTSINDASQGVNTGSGAAPADWTGVMLQASGSAFDYCDFEYAGSGDKAALTLSGSKATVTHSIFAHDQGPTNSFNAAPALDAGGAVAGTVIQNNTFYDNRVPLIISENISLDDTNVFDNHAAAPTDPRPNTFNGVEFVGTHGCNNAIVSNILWSTTKVPFIIGTPANGDLCVASAGHLTLGPGVILKFFPDAIVNVGLSANDTGTLTTAAGNIFTSIKDDVGGDTNGDGSASAPLSGDWGGVSLNSDGMTFDHVAFYYAGLAGGSDTAALAVNTYSVTVTNSIFANNQGPTDSAYAMPALLAYEAAAGTVIKNNVFYGNRVPMAIGPSVSLDDSNSFDNSAAAPNSPLPNEYNGVVLAGTNGCNNAIVSNITLSTSKVPFVVGTPAYQDLCVAQGGQLTLGSNVTMKFYPAGHLTVGSNGGGTLTTGSGDVFTSIKDDAPTHGGDTDHDSMANQPAPGDWSGIVENQVCETWSNILYSTTGCP